MELSPHFFFPNKESSAFTSQSLHFYSTLYFFFFKAVSFLLFFSLPPSLSPSKQTNENKQTTATTTTKKDACRFCQMIQLLKLNLFTFKTIKLFNL